MSLALLRQQIARVLDDGKPPAPTLPTGIAALDAVLVGGGLPRGRLSEVVGRRGSGKTTFVRGLVERTLAEPGAMVAYVDAARTLAPRDWAHLGDRGVWMVRPLDAARGAWCADVLLRSGAFALVVLDGAPVLARPTAVRLTRLARDGGAALVVLGDDAGASGTMLGGALQLRVERRMGRDRRRRMMVTVEKGGTRQAAELACEVVVTVRLGVHPEPPDRRGAATRVAARRGR